MTSGGANDGDGQIASVDEATDGYGWCRRRSGATRGFDDTKSVQVKRILRKEATRDSMVNSSSQVGTTGVSDGDRGSYTRGVVSGSWADQDPQFPDQEPFVLRFRGRRVAFDDLREVIEVPDQFSTYGFDVRSYDLGTEGLIRRTRVSRELRDLRR